jgi:hypothetical protein
LSHVLEPDSPVWKGFPPTTRFSPKALAGWMMTAPYAPFTYEKTGLETTAYTFATDQFGTQLDPPAHWHPCFAAIDELPPTLALRKLAVISIAEQVQGRCEPPAHGCRRASPGSAGTGAFRPGRWSWCARTGTSGGRMPEALSAGGWPLSRRVAGKR